MIIMLCQVCRAQDLSVLRARMEGTQQIGKENFESSLDTFMRKSAIPADSLRVYKQWLRQNKKALFSGSSSYFRVHYFRERSFVHAGLHEYEDAFRSLDSALAYFDHRQHPGAYFHISDDGVWMANGWRDYNMSIKLLEDLLGSGLFDRDTASLQKVLLQLSRYHLYQHQYEPSMHYCIKVFPLLEQSGDHNEMVNTLVRMYDNSHFSAADSSNTTYLDRALEIAHTHCDSITTANLYATIGRSLYRNGRHQKAIEYYKLGRSYISDKESHLEINTAIMQMLSNLISDSIDEAYRLSLYVEKQAVSAGFYSALGNAYRGRATCFAAWGIRDSAMHYLDRAFDARVNNSHPENLSAGFFYYLYETAMMIKDYERALKYLSKSLDQYTLIQRRYNATDLNKIRAEYDYDYQREKIENLRLENEVKRQSIVKLNLLIAFVCSILSIMVLFLLILRRHFRKLRQAYRKLVHKNLELDRLYKDLSRCDEQQGGGRNGPVVRDEESLFRKLSELLEKEKIYREPELSLSKLSDLLDTNRTYLSSVINKRFQMSFKAVLNRYRIDEARRLLVRDDYANYSIEGIAKEVGFLSRSVFYTAFRQQTGMTPSDYLRAFKSINRGKDEILKD